MYGPIPIPSSQGSLLDLIAGSGGLIDAFNRRKRTADIDQWVAQNFPGVINPETLSIRSGEEQRKFGNERALKAEALSERQIADLEQRTRDAMDMFTKTLQLNRDKFDFDKNISNRKLLIEEGDRRDRSLANVLNFTLNWGLLDPTIRKATTEADLADLTYQNAKLSAPILRNLDEARTNFIKAQTRLLENTNPTAQDFLTAMREMINLTGVLTNIGVPQAVLQQFVGKALQSFENKFGPNTLSNSAGQLSLDQSRRTVINDQLDTLIDELSTTAKRYPGTSGSWFGDFVDRISNVSAIPDTFLSEEGFSRRVNDYNRGKIVKDALETLKYLRENSDKFSPEQLDKNVERIYYILNSVDPKLGFGRPKEK